MPSLAFGKVDTAGEYTPRLLTPRAMRTRADTVVFCPLLVVRAPR
jgi:hypothetical protein